MDVSILCKLVVLSLLCFLSGRTIAYNSTWRFPQNGFKVRRHNCLPLIGPPRRRPHLSEAVSTEHQTRYRHHKFKYEKSPIQNRQHPPPPICISLSRFTTSLSLFTMSTDKPPLPQPLPFFTMTSAIKAVIIRPNGDV